MIFPANDLTGAKTGLEPNQTATKLQHENLYKRLNTYKLSG